jgi:hypothetical protein
MNCFEAQTSTNNGISHFRSAQKKLRKKLNKTVTESCLMVSFYDLLSLGHGELLELRLLEKSARHDFIIARHRSSNNIFSCQLLESS